MAVHVPLSIPSQLEARVLMMASQNVLHPASGKPITLPSQDMILGCYYLTREKKDQVGEGMSFGSIDEVKIAHDNGRVAMHAIINVRHNGEWHKNTTTGRAIYNSIIPDKLGYYDEIISKKRLSFIIGESFVKAGNQRTVQLLDDLKDIGFKTFDSYWSEDYDNFTHIERMKKILDIVDWISVQYNVHKLKQEMQSILEHNFNHYGMVVEDIFLSRMLGQI